MRLSLGNVYFLLKFVCIANSQQGAKLRFLSTEIRTHTIFYFQHLIHRHVHFVSIIIANCRLRTY